MSADWQLREGDVFVRIKGRRARFVIEGFTSRGKVRYRNVDTGSVATAWWSTRASVPKQYRFEDPRD